MRSRSVLPVSVALVASALATGSVSASDAAAGSDSLQPAERVASTNSTESGLDFPGAVPQGSDEEPEAKQLPADQVPSGPVNEAIEGSVLITEILFNPTQVYDSRGEWFEVVNTTNDAIDMTGWTFGDEIYDIHTIGELKIGPGERLVFARLADAARNGGVEADYEFGDSVLLYNVGDRIVLRNADGSVVDAVNYGESDFDRPAARSISFDGASVASSAVANDAGANWCSATTTLPGGDFGSPGEANQCDDSSASLVVSEILNNPAGVSDSVGEWFELVNTGAATIDLDGFTVQDDDRESVTVDGTLLVAAGGRVVFGRSADLSINGGVNVDVAYGDAMALHNTYDELVVLDQLGIQVDAVRWDDGRTFPDANGASMQLASLAADNADGANWCESTPRWATGDRGTPGAAGSCDLLELPQLVITEIMPDPELTSSERQGEWFEVVNIGSEVAVLDGFLLRTRSEEHIISSVSIAAGERAVFGVNADSAANGGVPVDYAYGTDLSLFNASGVVEILGPDATSIDRVEYSSTNGFPLEKAHSLELGATTTDNSLGANWCITIERYNDLDFGTPGTAGSCDAPAPLVPLQISEIMRNPAVVTDRDGEWFEIFNPTADDVDLYNWSIGDEGSEHYVIGESVIVPADGFAVIARSGDVATNGGVAADLAVGTGMVLYNSSDEIVIHDQHGREVDSVRWTSTDLMPRPNGGSMSRTDASLASFAPSNDASEWCTTSAQFGAGDTGTPGAANSCTPQPNNAIVINEIHRDPEQEPDSQGEWIELHNSGDQAIDIGGWTLRDDDVDSFVIPANTVIDAGGFVTAGRNDESLNGGIEMDFLYGIEIINFNTTDELMLFDTDLAVIDRVAWNAENGFPKVSGATMSLRDAATDNSVGSNWCAAVTDQGNGDFGTPGAANLCEVPEEPDPVDPSQPTDVTHALFATGGCSGDVIVEASSFDVGGIVRSNDDLTARASNGQFRDEVTYADQAGIAGLSSSSNQPVQDAEYQRVPFGWAIGDFAPGGALAVAAGDDYHVHDGGLTVNANAVSLPAGIHYVTGDVTFNTKKVSLNEVTIVATGKITINTNKLSLNAFGNDLPVLMSGLSDCYQQGVTLSTSVVSLIGTVYAPDSKVVVNASVVGTDSGGYIGSSVIVRASRVAITTS